MGYVFVGPDAPTQEQLDAITAALGIPEDAILWAEVDVTLALRPKAGSSLTVGSAVTLQFVNGTFTVKAGSSDTLGAIPTLTPEGDAFLVGTGTSDTVGGVVALSLTDGSFVIKVGVSDNAGTIVTMEANVPPSFTSQPVALRVTNNGIHFGYDTADPDGDHYDVSYRFDGSGGWTTIFTNEIPGNGNVVYVTNGGLTGSHTIVLRLTARTGDATPVDSDSVAVNIPNLTLEFLGQTIGNEPSGWTNNTRHGSFTIQDGPAVGSLANRVARQVYGAGTPGADYNWDYKQITTVEYSKISWRVKRTAGSGDCTAIRVGGSSTGYIEIIEMSDNGHFRYMDGSSVYHNLSVDTMWVGDTWFDIELRNINYTAKTFDLWIAGAEVVVGMAFRTDYSGSGAFQMDLVSGYPGGAAVTMWLDYINCWN
jgi:hypothetical protein